MEPMFSKEIRNLDNNEIAKMLYNISTTLNAIAIVLKERELKKSWDNITDAFCSIETAHQYLKASMIYDKRNP